MKTKTLLALFAVMCAASIIIAQTSNYTAVEAAKHVGQKFVPSYAHFVTHNRMGLKAIGFF
jgi:hypothetical protein